MPTLPSAPLPELDWPTQTSIFVDAGDPNAVVESLIILVSEDAPSVPEADTPVVPIFAYGTGTAQVAFVGDGGGGTAPEGSRADATFLGGEATLYAFSDEKVENAQRNIYRADDSGVIYALVFSIPATQLPGFVADTARYWAAVWNANAAIPGVTAIQETQQTDAFGQLSDVAEVAVSSTSGKSSTIATVAQADYPTDRFAEKVAYWRGVLDAGEATH